MALHAREDAVLNSVQIPGEVINWLLLDTEHVTDLVEGVLGGLADLAHVDALVR